MLLCSLSSAYPKCLNLSSSGSHVSSSGSHVSSSGPHVNGPVTHVSGSRLYVMVLILLSMVLVLMLMTPNQSPEVFCMRGNQIIPIIHSSSINSQQSHL